MNPRVTRRSVLMTGAAAFALGGTVTETTALGAAYLAGLAVGFWKSPQEVAAQWQVERRFEPQMPSSQVRQLREQWNHALGRARNWEGTHDA